MEKQYSLIERKFIDVLNSIDSVYINSKKYSLPNLISDVERSKRKKFEDSELADLITDFVDRFARILEICI